MIPFPVLLVAKYLMPLFYFRKFWNSDIYYIGFRVKDSTKRSLRR